MNSKSKQKWIEQAQTNKSILLFYKQKVLDVTQFIKYHPGGVKAIKNYINKDISKLYFKVFPHNQSHFQTLMEYSCGVIQDYQNIQEESKRSAFRFKTTIQLALKEDQMSSKQSKKVIFQPNCIQYQMPDKKQKRKKLINMQAKQQQNQIYFDEDQNIDQQKPIFQLKKLIKKQIQF